VVSRFCSGQIQDLGLARHRLASPVEVGCVDVNQHHLISRVLHRSSGLEVLLRRFFLLAGRGGEVEVYGGVVRWRCCLPRPAVVAWGGWQSVASSSTPRWRRSLLLVMRHRLPCLPGHSGVGRLVSVTVSSSSVWSVYGVFFSGGLR
jgi:hypothetical protein